MLVRAADDVNIVNVGDARKQSQINIVAKVCRRTPFSWRQLILKGPIISLGDEQLAIDVKVGSIE